ncbi:MAG: hypothetical protein ACLFST_05725 [Spirochaetia bacterium]
MLAITDDLNGFHRAESMDKVREVTDLLLSIKPDQVALDTASPDLTNYPTEIGTENPTMKKSPYHAEDPDPLATVVPLIRDAGVRVLANIRMNDHHGRESQWAEWERQHVEWSLGEDLGFRDWKSIGKLRCMDYAVAGVRQHRLSIIDEILTRYDYQGLQLDFSRTPPFLSNPKKENAPHLTGYIREVRKLLNEKRSGTGSVLGAVVPFDLELCRREGMEMEKWIKEGLLDFVSPGDKYYADWNIDFTPWFTLARDTSCTVIPVTHGNVSPFQDFEKGEVSLLGDNSVLDLPKIRAIADNVKSQGTEHFGFYNFYTFDFGQIYPELREAVDPEANKGAKKHFFYCRKPEYFYREYLAFDKGAAFQRYALMDPGESAALPFRFTKDPESENFKLNIAVQNLMPKDQLEIKLNGTPLEFPERIHGAVERLGKTYHAGFFRTAISGNRLKNGINHLDFRITVRAEFREPLEIGEFEIFSGE